MNKYPLWKYLLIVIVLAIGTLYALPNLYPEVPAVQVSSTSTDVKVNEDTIERVRGILDDAGISATRIDLEEQNR